ncbi:sigma E regulatory protein, MucB/RseB [Nitrosomonas aestuarii]|uniref:Sigma E regulatory protein, MucB/RseB n=1 Tax=Nitrosomonas aestuarii TaxID=52441 RepID=A0A1I3YN11_9PROT|nr:MucB/RseB C-terminal domain-containing protein [Nitrosomonas aestuarii]SFK33204.1 sigma E regulatory protein, MucB/RseB [Nitrosomonas aestuarii]
MKNHILPFLLLLLVSAFQTVIAESQPQSSDKAFDWIQKVATAPRQYNYSGTFVYYADNYMESSQVTHKVDHEGEFEKIEVLDGSTRIVFRNNDEMKCYLPDSKKIYTEKRWFRKFFPDLLPQPSERIKENYNIQIKKQERVAGYDGQILMLVPKDNLRYGYKFWIHVDSGLLLKAAVMDKENIIEQFAFAQIEIDGEIDASILDPDSSFKATKNWKTINLSTVLLDEGELAWRLGKLPSGFKKVAEMKRNLVGKSLMVDHIVLSDELASVSVFIEPVIKDTSSPVPGFYSSRGAINIYVRELENNKITTVGEVPLNTIKLIGDAVRLQ